MQLTDEALEALTELAGVVLVATDLPQTFVSMCRTAVQALPAADGASVTTVAEGRPSAVASDAWAQELDELQFEEHEGPCLDAFRTGNAFRVRDFASESRWPSYSEQVLARGARSTMSVPLTAQGNVLGALNLYAKHPDAFDAESASIGAVIGGHMGLASEVSAAFFRHRDLAEQLAEAMKSRAVIEQAKGVLMAQFGCDAYTAFDLLREKSQRGNLKLRQVAHDIVNDVST